MDEVTAFVMDGAGGAEAVAPEGRRVADLAPATGFVWVGVDFSSPAGLQWLQEAARDLVRYDRGRFPRRDPLPRSGERRARTAVAASGAPG